MQNSRQHRNLQAPDSHQNIRMLNCTRLIGVICQLVALLAYTSSLFSQNTESQNTGVRDTKVQGTKIDQDPGNVQDTKTPAEKFPGSKLLNIESYGFKIPQAEVSYPSDMRVRTLDQYGEAIVGKVHCKVGENYIVMLPDGQLVDRLAKDATVTDARFVAEKPRDLAEKLTAAGPLKGFNVKISGHYVFIYNTTEPFLQVTDRILKTMYQGVKNHAKRQKIDVSDPDVPLVVIMFHKEAQFQAYKALPRGVLAYYNMVTNHVVLHEESAFAGTRIDLARAQLISTIAHEGAHQILHNIGVQQRLSMWPMWLSEGIAEYFAPTSIGRNMRWQGAGHINNLRMFELERYLQSRSFKKLDGKTIAGAVEAVRLDSQGYATAWSIVHYLAKEKKTKFNEMVKFYSELPPLRGMTARLEQPVVENIDHFKEYFGDDFALQEKELVEHLNRQSDYVSPAAALPHFAAFAEVPVEGKPHRFAALFHDQELAELWVSELKETVSDSQREQLKTTINAYANREQAAATIKKWLN